MTMAAIANYGLTTPGVRNVQVAGSFVPNNTTQLVNAKGTDVFGTGFSVSRTGVGVFRVTITRPFAEVVSLVVGLTTDDTADHYIRVASPVKPVSTAGVLTNGYFDITHLSSADASVTRWAAADITASALLRRIHFCLVVAESDVPGGGV